MMIRKLFSNHFDPKQFMRFCVVGFGAAAISFLIYYLSTEWLKIWYVYSAICSFVISAIFNFIANKLWTFRNKEHGRRAIKQVLKFTLVTVSGLAINTLIIYFLTDFIKIHYLLSWVFATGVVMFWNFGLNRFWTFKKTDLSA